MKLTLIIENNKNQQLFLKVKGLERQVTRISNGFISSDRSRYCVDEGGGAFGYL
jgi:hypothetical protein